MQVFGLVLSLGLASSFLKVQSRYIADEGATHLHPAELSVQARSSDVDSSRRPRVSEDTARAYECDFEDPTLRLKCAMRFRYYGTELTEIGPALAQVQDELKKQINSTVIYQ
ncbi:hypothetical protein MTO96_023576 [Rhipicephalus appendiculatus]